MFAWNSGTEFQIGLIWNSKIFDKGGPLFFFKKIFFRLELSKNLIRGTLMFFRVPAALGRWNLGGEFRGPPDMYALLALILCRQIRTLTPVCQNGSLELLSRRYEGVFTKF